MHARAFTQLFFITPFSIALFITLLFAFFIFFSLFLAAAAAGFLQTFLAPQAWQGREVVNASIPIVVCVALYRRRGCHRAFFKRPQHGVSCHIEARLSPRLF
jgi:hypothetical protein